MKKLTAGIFATLMVIVSAGVARADIASTEYVNDQLDTKESVNNKATADATVTEANKDTMFPTVARMEKGLDDLSRQVDTSVDTKIKDMQTTTNMVADGAAADGLMQEADRKLRYTSVQAATDIARKEIDTKLGQDWDTTKDGFQTKANIVEDGAAVDGLTQEADRKSHYTSVMAATDIARKEIDTKLGQDWDTKVAGFQTKANIVEDGAAAGALTNESDRKSHYTSVQAANEMVDGALENAGFTRGEGGQWTSPYELANNKTDAVIADSDATAQATKFPTYRLTSQLITDKINQLKSENGNTYQPKNDLLTKLAELDTTACSAPGAECVLKYNNGTFGLEVITRGTPAE